MRNFLSRELEGKIFGEAFPIATELFVQPLGSDTVECRKIGVEDDFLAPNRDDEPLDGFRRNHESAFPTQSERRVSRSAASQSS